VVKRIIYELKQMRAAIFAILVYAVLANYFFGYMCPSMAIAGLPCPGCGLTRAALYLSLLDFKGALHFNPMVFFALPLIAAYAIIYIRGGDLKRLFYPTAVIIIVAFFVFFIRLKHGFGAEPLVINRNALIFRLLGQN